MIGDLLAPCGVRVDAQGHPALDEAVALQLAGVSRIEAVERIAAEVGLHPVWPNPQPAPAWGDETSVPDPLTFQDGPRALPAAFAGPFLVEIARLTEDAPDTVGTIELAVRALGLAGAVLAFQDEVAEVVRIDALRDADGVALTDEATRHMGTPDVRDGYFAYALEKNLVGLLRRVESIDRLSGQIRLPIPVAVEEVAWDGADREPKTVSVGTLSVSNWAASSAFELESASASLENVQVRTSPRRASGDPLGVQFSSASGWGTSMTANLQCPEPPAAVDLKVCTVETVAVPFQFEPIPLARASEQPLEREQLTFDGAAPVAVDVIADRPAGGEREVTLRATNTSNKHAMSLVVDFVYLDARGEQIGDFFYSLSGDYDFDVQDFGPFAAARGTAETTVNAPFVPDGTQTIRAELRSVDFPDGTTWDADE